MNDPKQPTIKKHRPHSPKIWQLPPKFTWTGIFDVEFGMQTHIQSTPSKFLHTARISEFRIIGHVCIYI